MYICFHNFSYKESKFFKGVVYSTIPEEFAYYFVEMKETPVVIHGEEVEVRVKRGRKKK